MKKITAFLLFNLLFCFGAYSQVINKQQTPDINVVSEAKNKIYQYYNKETFNEPEWIRVKNFLTWLSENEFSLNEYFWETYPDTDNSLNVETEKFIFAFLGANYISKQIVGKMFDIPITISWEGCYASSSQVHICIEPYNYMEVLNTSIHEAAHLLSAVGDVNISKNNYNIQYSDFLSEEITIFAQLKYALPLKFGKILHGTRAFFILADEESVKQKIDHIKGEYADIVYPITDYSSYDENKVLNTKIRKSRSVYQIVELIFNGINNNYLGKDYNLNDDEVYYLQSTIFQNVKQEMENHFFFNISKYDNYSKGYLQKLLSDNEDEIMFFFVKNLKKYADKNIPPVPEGYI